ncbi:MAG: Wzz/FepE/Etk N-terminal domain-containing protein, partial [Bacteroidota bacterium]
GGLLQQYGGMLGISGAGSGGAESGIIPPQLYPNIVESLPYQVELMNTEVYFSEYDTTATVHDFFNEIHSPFSLVGFIKGYTIGLPGKIIGLFKAEEQEFQPLPGKVDRDSVLKLNKDQMETVKTLRNRLSISVDEETGILTLTSEFPDPQAAAEIGRAGINLLKENVKEYRTQKARQNLGFVEEQTESARDRFETIQQRLAEFRDSNQNLSTARAQTREQELQSEYDLRFEIYNSLTQRREQAQLELQEDEPILSVLQPVSVPLEDNTSGLLILIVSGMLGGIVSLGWVVISSWWEQERIRFK